MNSLITEGAVDRFPSGVSFSLFVAEGQRRIIQLRHEAARASPPTSDPPGPAVVPDVHADRPQLRVEIKKAS
eukprot:8780549-Pyramimonas_sp.AAC.1